MNEEFNKAGRGNDLGKGNLRSRSNRSVDVRKYEKFLDGMDIPEAEKQAYLEGVWLFVDIFVTHSFGIHPVQEVCGQLAANSPEAPTRAFNRVSSEDHRTTRGLKSHTPEA
ncbi:MAG: hypothetical protein GW798_03930 [Roseovarius sp.]|nr:hypothetical protein [Roseovarius sp.]